MTPIEFIIASFLAGLLTYQDALSECDKSIDPRQCIIQLHTTDDYYSDDE